MTSDNIIDNEDYQLTIEKINTERRAHLAAYATMLDEKTKHRVEQLVCNLVLERKKQGLTQQDIADRTGMKTSNIARFETNKCTPTFQFIEKYADALGKTINYSIESK